MDISKYYTEEQKLLVEEQKQVHERIIAINDKINKLPYDCEDEERNLINLQAFSMRSYNFALLARIEKFKKEIKLQLKV